MLIFLTDALSKINMFQIPFSFLFFVISEIFWPMTETVLILLEMVTLPMGWLDRWLAGWIAGKVIPPYCPLLWCGCGME